MVDAGKILAGMDVRNGTGVDEIIAQALADADEQEQQRGDAGENDRTLSQGAQGAARLASGNGVAASAIGEWSVFAFASA